jgi:hypothetical protein
MQPLYVAALHSVMCTVCCVCSLNSVLALWNLLLLCLALCNCCHFNLLMQPSWDWQGNHGTKRIGGTKGASSPNTLLSDSHWRSPPKSMWKIITLTHHDSLFIHTLWNCPVCYFVCLNNNNYVGYGLLCNFCIGADVFSFFSIIFMGTLYVWLGSIPFNYQSVQEINWI